MYDRSVVRRRRAALAVLVALSLFLLTAYFGEGPGGLLHGVQRGAQEVLSPVQSGASRALKPFRDLVGWTGDVLSAESENDRLKREVERLRGALAEAQTARRDADQLRQLAGLSRTEGYPQGTEPLTARVISHSPTVWFRNVLIDKGRDDGVRVDQPVVAAGGLAGRVTSVSDGSAQVTLITDETSAVSAQVVPDGANGVVRPRVGDPDDLLLEFLDRRRRIEENDTVVTSGSTSDRFESLFPRGIPIGRVRRVDAGDRELYQRVHLEPFADLRRMDFVQVLTARPDDQRAGASVP